MSAASDLTHASWQTFSRLLDEALELPPGERLTWLEALGPEHDGVKPALQAVLQRTARGETAQWLATLPRSESAERLLDESDLQPDARIGPYRLIRELGSGGMGAVWLAERADGTLKRQVALKLPRATWTRGLAERMVRERDILASLEHPNIARLYDAGTDAQGRPYLALEYVEGQPIDVYCRSQGLSVRNRVRLILQVTEAVAFAHGRLVLHRDLKPSNILVTSAGQVRLLDFGIAKLMERDVAEATELTQAAGRVLTPQYASPEQVRGEPLGMASDVYSLGVVAFELLTGSRPYKLKRGSAAELEEAIADQELPIASRIAEAADDRRALRGDLDAILNLALKKSSTERYATADALAHDLRSWLAGQRVLARPDTLAYRLSRFARRHRTALGLGVITIAAFALALGVGATALVIAALLLGLAAALWQARRAREQARLARTEARRAMAVQRFMTDIFRANSDHNEDPVKARATTARELLDLGAARLDASLSDAPEARAEVLQMLGEMYYELQLDEQAVMLDERLITLRRQLYGPNDRRVAESLIRLAGSLHSTPHRERILPALQEAEQILDAAGDGDSALRGQLLARLAQRYYNISQVRAREYADGAIRVLRAQAQPDPDYLSTALVLAGRNRAASGELGGAETLYREAIVELEKLPVPGHADLQEIRISLAEVLGQRLATAEALSLAEHAVEAGRAALGERNPANIAAQARFAMLLHARGERRRARAMLTSALERIVEVRGDGDTMYTLLVQHAFARLCLAEGALQEARERVQRVIPVFRRHYEGSGALSLALRTEAVIEAGRGDLTVARRLLEESLQTLERAAAGAYQRWRFNRAHLDLAQIDLWEGKPGQALERLAQVVDPREVDIPSPQPDAIERAQLAAFAHLLANRLDEAHGQAAKVAMALPALTARARFPALEADGALLRGRLEMARGNQEAALESLGQALAFRREFDHPTSPWIAEVEIALAGCRLASGDGERARIHVNAALQILDASVDAGEQFRQPLRDVSARLG